MGALFVVFVILCVLKPELFLIALGVLYLFVVYLVGNAGHPLAATAMVLVPLAVLLLGRWWLMGMPRPRLPARQTWTTAGSRLGELLCVLVLFIVTISTALPGVAARKGK